MVAIAAYSTFAAIRGRVSFGSRTKGYIGLAGTTCTMVVGTDLAFIGVLCNTVIGVINP